jgi:hypothetical protein
MVVKASKFSFRASATLTLLVVGIWADFFAWFSAYGTFATNDYGPILIRGGVSCGVAIAAFFMATSYYRSHLVRAVSLLGGAAVLPPLVEILRRLQY